MLEVSQLSIDGLLSNVSFQLHPSQRLGIIGESGSGKSLTALSLIGLLPSKLRARGSIKFFDQELIGVSDKKLRPLRGKRIAIVFQEPMSALDPLMKIGAHVTGTQLSEVGLDPELANRYPHELSGGQRQRILIAMAMAHKPDILICDEPTTALDTTSSQQVLKVINELVERHHTALIFISHDLNVIEYMSDDVIVMCQGEIVEAGPSVLSNPRHEYTQELIAASQPNPAAPQPATGESVIVIDRVTKSFGATPVLNDFHLKVLRGERLGLVGDSGTGKTTALKLIAGLIEPDSGDITVKGSVQMVFQDPQGSLNPRMRIEDIVAEGGSRDQVDEVLQEVGIDPGHKRRYPHEFSGGQRQRISIARAIIGNPDILLADEAVSALDVSVRAQILELLERLVAERGMTLVFISHDQHAIQQLCNRIVTVK